MTGVRIKRCCSPTFFHFRYPATECSRSLKRICIDLVPLYAGAALYPDSRQQFIHSDSNPALNARFNIAHLKQLSARNNASLGGPPSLGPPSLFFFLFIRPPPISPLFPYPPLSQ